MTRLASLAALAALALAASGLTACQKQIDAPLDKGVCWHAVTLPSGELKFNKLSEHEPTRRHVPRYGQGCCCCRCCFCCWRC